MTRETAKQLLPIIQAYAYGEIIQYSNDDGKTWFDLDIFEWYNDVSYRIKPDPKYRPFRTKEECLNEMHNHPCLGLVMTKSGGELKVADVSTFGIRFVLFCIDGIRLSPQVHDFTESFTLFRFIDGTTFGIKEE